MKGLNCGILRSNENSSIHWNWVEQQDIEGKFFVNLHTMAVCRNSKYMDDNRNNRRSTSALAGKTVSIRQSLRNNGTLSTLSKDPACQTRSKIFIAQNGAITSCLESDKANLMNKKLAAQNSNSSLLMKYFKMNIVDKILEGSQLCIELGETHLMVINLDLRKIHIMIDYRCITAFVCKGSNSAREGATDGKKSAHCLKKVAISFLDTMSENCLVMTFQVQDYYRMLQTTLNRSLNINKSTQKLMSLMSSGRNVAPGGSKKENSNMRALANDQGNGRIDIRARAGGILEDVDSEDSRAMRKASSSISFEIVINNDQLLDNMPDGSLHKGANKNCAKQRMEKGHDKKSNVANEDDVIASLVLRKKSKELQANARGGAKHAKDQQQPANSRGFPDSLRNELMLSITCFRLQLSHDYISIKDKCHLRVKLIHSTKLSEKVDLKVLESKAESEMKSYQTKGKDSPKALISDGDCLQIKLMFDKILLVNSQFIESVKFEFDIDKIFAFGLCGNDNRGVYIGYKLENLSNNNSYHFHVLSSDEDLTVFAKSVVRWVKLFRDCAN